MPSSPSSSRARLDSMDEEERESAALHVRERIYVTFATLAVALTLSSHAEDLGAGAAAAIVPPPLAAIGLATLGL